MVKNKKKRKIIQDNDQSRRLTNSRLYTSTHQSRSRLHSCVFWFIELVLKVTVDLNFRFFFPHHIFVGNSVTIKLWAMVKNPREHWSCLKKFPQVTFCSWDIVFLKMGGTDRRAFLKTKYGQEALKCDKVYREKMGIIPKEVVAYILWKLHLNFYQILPRGFFCCKITFWFLHKLLGDSSALVGESVDLHYIQITNLLLASIPAG